MTRREGQSLTDVDTKTTEFHEPLDQHDIVWILLSSRKPQKNLIKGWGSWLKDFMQELKNGTYHSQQFRTCLGARVLQCAAGERTAQAVYMYMSIY